MKKFINVNKYYLLTIILLLLTFILVKKHFTYELLTFDTYIYNKIMNFVNKETVTNILTGITHMGSVYFYIAILIIFIFVNKKLFLYTSLPLSITFLISTIFKNIIKRERPSEALIKMPSDYSFPSGHTICAVVFYGILIYFISNSNLKKHHKIIFEVLLTLLISLIAFSRLYLGVHYLSDVLASLVLGTLSLVMFIRYYKITNINLERK